ncbi:hypothetical protein Cpa01nite_23380 [Cellulomonas pakistanensis]|uniref:Uncharacterized protein n=1 Tax=Cellulomonas pakistanensis TaxID=992287 RepID=A0A919U7G2_9CELL|nr:hypothetical protein Cpa01nite_23380 [Cellulomonas pakistanensis]
MRSGGRPVTGGRLSGQRARPIPARAAPGGKPDARALAYAGPAADLSVRAGTGRVLARGPEKGREETPARRRTTSPGGPRARPPGRLGV